MNTEITKYCRLIYLIKTKQIKAIAINKQHTNKNGTNIVCGHNEDYAILQADTEAELMAMANELQLTNELIN